ncbi:MAG: aminomethyl-transferring glycine dehydrogenase [Acidimicrobiales bacterium]|nr:aminomethyl-transferring glycine dehydrogenase [Acidimicrobiales bacterium]
MDTTEMSNPTEPLPSLDELLDDTAFHRRHLGPDEAGVTQMLEVVGSPNLDDLIDAIIPESIRDRTPLDLAGPMGEEEALSRLRGFADRNTVVTSLIGTGWYDTHMPAVIARNVFENPAWYTAYTPYQPEISQGRLEVLLGFQTMISDLTGMDLANASLLDEATAGAEAMTLLKRAHRGDRNTFLVDSDCHPQVIDVIRTRARPLGIEIQTADPWTAQLDGDHDVFGSLIAFPGSGGNLRPLDRVVDHLRGAGVGVAVTADLLALCLVTPPGEFGVDVVVGSAQRFGVPMGFGGPHAGFMAVSEQHKRMLPGRLVGTSVDSHGKTAHRLALQTREQHIRRERATSNICTAQVLLAVISALYAAYHGPAGLRRIAQRTNRLASMLATGLIDAGFNVVNDTFFDTISVHLAGRADEIISSALERGCNLRRIDDDTVGISLDETTLPGTIEAVLASFGVEGIDLASLDSGARPGIPAEMRRQSPFCTSEFFNSHHSETSMLRWLRKLADRDLALDRTMIPLGSCTMKLNATTEMAAVSWPEFSRIHPYAPPTQVLGYLDLISDLEQMLVEITGYSAVSLQPNAGSQGELAGLLAIRAWHDSRGDQQRVVCLIPSSAHGTNAASATMAGMEVVVVDSADDGSVDLDSLRSSVDESGERLATLMITYPSTHGVFEPQISEICDLVHEAGGQVYLDGANLNAMVGLARPGQFGADVSHLNLHKTFCIPHGGGGPGVGPVAVREHLAPFLPGHPVVRGAGPESGIGAVSAAPFGSAGILPISWAYVSMMGASGLRHATELAILSANYVAARLSPHFPILYGGEAGFVAHECILDVRVLNKYGVSAEDVCKRLVDYGFHAPTVSFPVPGTLMVEPTESEDLVELDRFCDAMIAIAGEAQRIVNGEWPVDDNPLVNAPHTAEHLAGTWSHPYDRQTAAFPAPNTGPDKYWPPVARVDSVYGDKNLMCSCPPVSEYA